MATPRGLFKSEDGGRGWRPRGGGLPLLDITGLAVGPDGRTLYASEFTQGGLWRSDDAGETWAEVPTDGLATTRIWALALDPRPSGRLLAATPSGGLHEWRPAGGHPRPARPGWRAARAETNPPVAAPGEPHHTLTPARE